MLGRRLFELGCYTYVHALQVELVAQRDWQTSGDGSLVSKLLRLAPGRLMLVSRPRRTPDVTGDEATAFGTARANGPRHRRSRLRSRPRRALPTSDSTAPASDRAACRRPRFATAHICGARSRALFGQRDRRQREVVRARPIDSGLHRRRETVALVTSLMPALEGLASHSRRFGAAPHEANAPAGETFGTVGAGFAFRGERG